MGCYNKLEKSIVLKGRKTHPFKERRIGK